jgi:hypothetical protein
MNWREFGRSDAWSDYEIPRKTSNSIAGLRVEI